MCDLFHQPGSVNYVVWDRKTFNTVDESMEALRTSKTIYVGNLSIFTTELQIDEIFSTVGPVKRIIMGLNSKTKEPCGFCFVEYFTQEHAYACLKYLHETRCDGRIIRCDLDAGFFPGRQYGRGKSGGQVQDDKRAQMGMRHDPGRGGVIQYDATGGKRRRHEADREKNDRSMADVLQEGLSSQRASKDTIAILRTLDGALPTGRDGGRDGDRLGGRDGAAGGGHREPRQLGTAYVAVGVAPKAMSSVGAGRIVHLGSLVEMADSGAQGHGGAADDDERGAGSRGRDEDDGEGEEQARKRRGVEREE